jgi:UDP-N-acetylglucosamine 2-epimerase (non-hydrolysing)
VHGDTTTTFATSLAAFYQQIPIGHVEAGLRTGNLMSPWPEEGNRALTGRIARFHFAPTELARNNLLQENMAPESILVTGNTVIDALLLVAEKLQKENFDLRTIKGLEDLSINKKLILVTCHRRESFGKGIINVCEALKAIATQHPDTVIVYPVHLNPNVTEPVFQHLNQIDNIFLVEPQEYLPFVALMNAAHLILTDSGGIQEEAPSLSKPVLVMRPVSERQEAIAAGTVKLVGTDTKMIISEVSELLSSQENYMRMAKAENPYGDGTASRQIINFMKAHL